MGRIHPGASKEKIGDTAKRIDMIKKIDYDIDYLFIMPAVYKATNLEEFLWNSKNFTVKY